MILAERSAVTVYSDVMAFLMMLGLVCLSSRLRKRETTGEKLYFVLCLAVMVDAVCSSICYALHEQPFGATAELIFKTILEMSMLVLAYYWLLYVDFKLFGSKDHLIRRLGVLFVPILAGAVALVINLFTGIVFTIGPDNHYVPTVLYHVLEGLEYYYFLLSLILYVQSRMEGRQVHFFHIAPVLLPTIAGTFINIFTPYSAAALGFSIALIFMYFSMIDAWRFDDAETGLYNKEYLSYVIAMVQDGRRECRNVLTFETKSNPEALAEILKRDAPRDGELIHTGEGRFVLLLEQGEKSALKLLQTLIEEAAAEYDEAHKGQEIALTQTCRMRRKGEDTAALIAACR
ncbi:MAG: hypothetical protein IKO80_00205 [Lachnospiraceae bacterium]|nr:hypothetical protein [Lachnospiraceae bacterium]